MRKRFTLLIAVVLVTAAGSTLGVRIATRHPSIVLNPRAVDFGPLVARATRTVAAGGVATLAITFDPVAHGPVAGPARHAVYLRTNDPRTPEAEIEVRAVV